MELNRMKKPVRILAAALLWLGPATPDNADLPRWLRHAANVVITRDDWGIAHVRGKTDADAIFGMRSEVEAQELTDAYEETLDLYREAFGEPPAGSWVSSEGAARCRRQCAPMKCKWTARWPVSGGSWAEHRSVMKPFRPPQTKSIVHFPF